MAIEKSAPAPPFRVPFRQDARPVASSGFEATLAAVLGESPARDTPLRVALPREFSNPNPAGKAGTAKPDGPPAGQAKAERPEGPLAAQAKAVRPGGPPTARGAIILTPEILLSDTPTPAASAKPVTPQGPAVARGAIILTPEAPGSRALTEGEAGQATSASATATPAPSSPTSATSSPAALPPASAAASPGEPLSMAAAEPGSKAAAASKRAVPASTGPDIPASTGQTAARAAPDAPPGQARTDAPGGFTAEEEAMLFAAARSVKPPPKRALPANASPLDARPSEVAAGVNADPDSVLKTAAAQIGRRYASGGETPRQGFDCSGLTSYVFAKSGLELPRSSREQFRHGQPVKREELKKGDLVFFGKKGVNHVGVYLEDGKFIHAASTAGSVKVGSLDDPVWDKLYAGARRII